MTSYSILAVNDYALHAIEAATEKANSLSLSSFLPWKREPPAHAVIISNFESAMSTLSANMERLIVEAEVSLSQLARLEERLTVLHETLAREGNAVGEARDELLADLWTMLGGNKAKRRNLDAHGRLLAELAVYRRRALAHVAGALQTLAGMEADMDELRARVATPEIAGSAIPPEVHMRKPFGFLPAAESADWRYFRRYQERPRALARGPPPRTRSGRGRRQTRS
jgi:hypothetical protein